MATVARLNAQIGLTEAFKNLRMPFRGNANACVGDREQDTGVFPLHPKHHRALVGEFERIAQQIHQDLHQPMSVGVHPHRQIVIQHHPVVQGRALDFG